MPTLKTLFVLCVCLCNLVLRLSFYDGVHTSMQIESQSPLETRAETTLSDSHACEEDITSPSGTIPVSTLGLGFRLLAAHFSTLSYIPIPLLPPPESE